MKRKLLQKVRFIRSMLLASTVLSLAFYGCKEEENLLSPGPNAGITSPSSIAVEDGRIAFNDPSSLKYFMEDARSKDFLAEYAPSIRKYEVQGFTSLTPLFDETQTDRIAQYKEAKLARLELEVAKNGRTFYEEELDDEDEIIADSYFASLLNEKRELQVGNMVYKYTEYGAFFTEKENMEKLYQYLEKVGERELISLPAGENTEVSPNVYLFKQDYRAGIQDSYQYEADEQTGNVGPVTTNLVPIDVPIDGPGGGGGGGGGSYTPPPPPTPYH